VYNLIKISKILGSENLKKRLKSLYAIILTKTDPFKALLRSQKYIEKFLVNSSSLIKMA